MIFICPGCNQKFKSDATGVVICPNCNKEVKIDPTQFGGTSIDRRSGGSYIDSFVETLKASLSSPELFFRQVKGGAGIAKPFIYALIISSLSFFVAFTYQLGFDMFGHKFSLALPFSFGIAILLMLIFVPIGTVFYLFMHAAICHLCLMILGAAKETFAATFRVVCFSAGPQLFQLVPFVGGIVGSVWNLILLIIGLKVVHETTYARSALAVFLPTIICCFCLVLIFVTIMGGVTAGLISSAGH